MPRATTTSDVFNAVAEPRRRAILDALARGERSVNELAESLQMPQPQMSKHLQVLKQVGLVDLRCEGRRRVYAIDGKRLRPLLEWVMTFEQFWRESYDRLDAYLEALQRKKADNDHE